MHTLLLVPEGFDRIEPGGFAGRDVAEDNADGGGEGKTDEDNRCIENEGHLQESRQRCGGQQGNGDADQTAKGGDDYGLDEELEQHFAFERADS